MGLYTYPVLMAADILLYNPLYVPVGEDQQQHLELTKLIAKRINGQENELFNIPQAIVFKSSKIMGIKEPWEKMSKSSKKDYNRINLLDDQHTVEKKINDALIGEVQNRSLDDAQTDPIVKNLIHIYSNLLESSPEQIIREFQAHKVYYFKNHLTELLNLLLQQMQKNFHNYSQDKVYLYEMLK